MVEFGCDFVALIATSDKAGRVVSLLRRKVGPSAGESGIIKAKKMYIHVNDNDYIALCSFIVQAEIAHRENCGAVTKLKFQVDYWIR